MQFNFILLLDSKYLSSYYKEDAMPEERTEQQIKGDQLLKARKTKFLAPKRWTLSSTTN